MKNKKIVVASIIIGGVLIVGFLYKKNKKSTLKIEDTGVSEDMPSAGGYGGGASYGSTEIPSNTAILIQNPATSSVPSNTGVVPPNTGLPALGNSLSSNPVPITLPINFGLRRKIGTIQNNTTPNSNFNGLANAELVTNHHLESFFGFNGLTNAQLVTGHGVSKFA